MMEGNTHLLQVIRKMHLEINKLERENRALRGELQFCGQRALQKEQKAGGKSGDGESWSLADHSEEPVGAPVPLRRNILTGPMLAPKEQKDNAMTVRRYSIASSVQPASGIRPHRADKRPPSNGLLEAQGRHQPPAGPAATQLARDKEEKKEVEKTPANCFSKSNSSKMKLFQEHVCKCRGKVKAVSFLLPMDTSPYAENPGSLKCPQNQNTKQLTTITEKDM